MCWDTLGDPDHTMHEKPMCPHPSDPQRDRERARAAVVVWTTRRSEAAMDHEEVLGLRGVWRFLDSQKVQDVTTLEQVAQAQRSFSTTAARY